MPDAYNAGGGNHPLISAEGAGTLSEYAKTPLSDARRLEAINLTGLDAEPDESFDRFAHLTQTVLSAPVALVSLVDDARQFFPGQAGLGLPWCDTRATPLSHSFCQIVAITGEPLIVTDARLDPRVQGNLAITDLGVIAYAGMPLTDQEGNILGSLCVIDLEPREWQPGELSLLADLAATCSAELQLRISVVRTSELHAERARLTAQMRAALHTTELLLTSSEALAAAATLTEVSAAVSHLVAGHIAPVFVGVGTIYAKDGQRRLRVPTATRSEMEHAWLHDIDAAQSPLLRAVRDNRSFFYATPTEILTDFPNLVDDLDELGWQSLACVPLPGPDGALGVLIFWWEQPYQTDLTERSVITALAGYTAQAVQRVLLLQDRIEVAETLQRSMLTDLPEPDHLHIVARYHPAHAGDQVGGDWYDAFLTSGGDTTLVIGDVAGHDITAAAQMGQIRSMLRVLAVDRDEPASEVLTRLDTAMASLGVNVLTSAVVARISQSTSEEHHGMRHLIWANAGHLPPLLLYADGTVDVLTGANAVLGLRATLPRQSQTVALPPESTLILYTDGLIEKRGEDIHDSVAKLRDAVSRLRHLPLGDLLDALIDTLTGHTSDDDIAILACRLHDETKPRPPEAGPEHT